MRRANPFPADKYSLSTLVRPVEAPLVLPQGASIVLPSLGSPSNLTPTRRALHATKDKKTSCCKSRVEPGIHQPSGIVFFLPSFFLLLLQWAAGVLACTFSFGQTTESGIPQPSRATVRYSRIHLDFLPRSATLICQLSLVPVFDTNSLRYIVYRALAFQLGRHRFLT